jgi:iron complex outermembrane recepter protein
MSTFVRSPSAARRALRHAPVAAAAAVLAVSTVSAVAQPSTAPAESTQPAQAAAPQTIVITGNPLKREGGPPASVLSGDALSRARAGTLGDTLAGLPGVAATGFGPQSSRPVIRGLDGDRIRILDNSAASVDASSLSFDHAPAIDPLVVERLEVLRGPAALLYGGNATGGVVNAIDNRVPTTALQSLSGRAELRAGGAARERAGAAVLEGSAAGLNWHADVAARNSGDLKTRQGRVVNSAGDSRAGALGASWADAQGFVGASVDSYRNEYGVVVEPEVTIDMKRSRLLLSGERRFESSPIQQLSFHASGTRYRHVEFEGSEVGTTFKSRGEEIRVQAQHAPWGASGAFSGVFGLQADHLDFSALGEEAFVPNTRTRSAALFGMESWQSGGLTLTAGLRGERVQVSSDGDDLNAAEPQFGPAQRRSFSPWSASLQASQQLGAGWRWSGQLGSTQRAPTYYELYANGIHVATGAFELGDPMLGLERSTHAELGVQWQADAALTHQFKAQVYTTRFSRYIALDATGNTVEEMGEDGEVEVFPEYAFQAVPARLHGLELEGRSRVWTAPWAVDAVAILDFVRGSNRNTGEPLPRLAPLRATFSLEATQGPWLASLTLRHAARQNRVPATDVATPAHTLLDAALSWQGKTALADVMVFLRANNLTDRLAFNASALRTARELSPLPGRGITAGLRASW